MASRSPITTPSGVQSSWSATTRPTKAATSSQTVTRYAPQGGVAFQSYPISDVQNYASVTVGTRTTYDALGRPTRVEQDSENGLIYTTYDYSAGFQTLVKPNNDTTRATLYQYQTYDQPTTDQIRVIAQPEGAYTDIQRDPFGKPTALTRYNADLSKMLSRLYYYNDAQELCGTYEPETQTSLMGYDDAGNLAWSASGLLWGQPCEEAGIAPAVVARKSTRTYDNRNRMTVLEFADDTGEQVWTYTPDSLPNTVWTYNGPGRTIGVYNAYSYNGRRMLGGTGETLHQAGWYTWALGYGYDRNGFVTVQSYPDTSSYTFAVNALGQTTGITGTGGTYVSGASYYPNGALNEFTYGNGILHKLNQNLEGRPLRSKDAYAGVAVLDDSYDYDNYGNVAAISDGLPGAPGNRSMTYDGLDRLKSVTSPMWGGTINYTYDLFDNIETLVAPAYGAVPARNLRYCYNTWQRIEFIRSGASSCTTGTATTTFNFDLQGNLWHKNQQEHKFTQDNRLREVVGKEKYRYDANGRRVTAEHATLGFIRSFYNKGGQLSFQADARQQKNFAYVYLAGSLVATREQSTPTGAAALKFNHTDALGTPVAVTDATRVVVERSQYEPFGKLLNRPIHDGPGYTGHVEDAQTGLTYMQQRYYDPQVGRLLSVDPVAVRPAGDNFNRYWYANNNPYKFTDPDGRETAMFQAEKYRMPQPSAEDTTQVLGVIADFTPGVGDAKGIYEAYQTPTFGNIAAAAVGFVPIAGDAAGKIIKAVSKSSGRVGDFTRAQRNAAKLDNAAQNGGTMACTDCGKAVQSVANQKGVPTPSNQAQVHHDPPIKDGGGQHSKPVVLCPECHVKRHQE